MTTKREYTGGSVSYYRVDVGNPISGNPGYTAECNDIIEALGMNYAEGNAFKAIWRSCAARTLGVSKEGYADGLYDAEKVRFFGGRMVAIARGEQSQPAPATPARAEELQADDGEIAREVRNFAEHVAAIRVDAGLPAWPTGGIVDQPTADDGWIEWGGGDQAPVPPDSHAVVLYRDGAKALTKAPQWLAWTHSKDAKDTNDIIAYRLTKEQA